MDNISIFSQQYPAGTTRIIKTQDGVSEVYCRHAIGEITGAYRTIPALVCDGFTRDDKWQIISLNAGLNNLKYVGTVAILGALDEEQAEGWAKRYFGLYAGASRAEFSGYAGAQALQLLLDNPASAENLPIRKTAICKFEGLVSMSPVVWNDDQLTSPVLSKLIHEMGLLDTNGQLLDPVTIADLPILVNELGGEYPEYDALIVDYSKMDLLAQRLNAAMSKASVGDIKPINMTQTKPFKRNGVTNIAMVFELSDGQSITIVFHNPDSTPNKLAAHDTMTSWKWMLNKRDVTAAVSPKEGDNVQLPVLARRILTLVDKNSARFKRANATKDTQVKELTVIADRVASKQTELEVVLGEIKLLEKQIDGVGKPVVSDTQQKNQQAFDGVAQVLVADYGWTQKGAVLEKSFTGVQAAGELNPDGSAIVTIRRKDVIIAATMGNGMDEPKIIGTEVLPQNNQNEADYRKTANSLNERIALYLQGRFGIDPSTTKAEESDVSNPDTDYLNSIIDGSADMTQGDAMQAELEAVAERLTPETEPLFEKAVDVYAAYQVAQASALI